MKRLIVVLLILSLLLLLFFSLKALIPLSSYEITIRNDIVDAVVVLQSETAVDPETAAKTYAYFGTDYQFTDPPELTVRSRRRLAGGYVVILHNPRVMDDSIHEMRDHIVLMELDDGIYKPVSHRRAHKGRGRFGWTSKPTL